MHRSRIASVLALSVAGILLVGSAAEAGKSTGSRTTAKKTTSASASAGTSTSATATPSASTRPPTTPPPAEPSPSASTGPAEPTVLPTVVEPTVSVPDVLAGTRVTPTRFGVGVQAHNDSKGINGWMPRVNVPWDYAYRYIGGGLNTGAGKNWTDWAANATFPLDYANAASARLYTPVLTYYTIYAARGTCDLCPEAQKDLSNLNNPDVMRLFYADFEKLMMRLGSGTHDGVVGFGKDAIVHVEPDLSGYANMAVLNPATKCFGFCSGTGNDPSLLRSSVRSSGHPVAQAYPDTYRGFNSTLLALRDRYAPKVRLALHVSNWATGYDINSATSPDLDATLLGQRAGAFAKASGAGWSDGTHSTYDLLFNDVSNKDAAYYTYVLGKPRFWDQDNVRFPNFHRWQAYVRAVTTTAERKAIVWQVPIGNQLYRSMNNTKGHWQDNRVEYFFNHVDELRAAGLVGMLFGTTIADATTYWDATVDGITNPEPICSSDGWSSGKVVCSSLQTPVVDDDGGYLRYSAQRYYANPLGL